MRSAQGFYLSGLPREQGECDEEKLNLMVDPEAGHRHVNRSERIFVDATKCKRLIFMRIMSHE